MQPKFKDKLSVTPGGRWVKAEGPVALNGREREAYIAVWITQEGGGGVTGMGIGEKEEDHLRKAVDAARERLSRRRGDCDSVLDDPDQGPQWDQLVDARDGRFEAGKTAKAVAWLLVRGQKPGDEYYVAWADEVTLVESRDLADDEDYLRRSGVREDDIAALRDEVRGPAQR